MKTILLAAGAAAIVLSAGATLAQTVAGPKQPIPYSQLNAYMKASPKARTSKDWWSGQTASASTGAASNTSAVTSAGADLRSTPDATPGTSSPATSVNPPSLGGETGAAPSSPSTSPLDTTPPGAVNPSPSAAPGAPPSATPPK
ncbi:hypothetical protein [Phenylobacterium sp.]|uniref:hypothetical protein n=1 Tax=Phenylobacterium sp. TaxID=1871053 RepID=UPI001210D206|nr:hypothetical protein [Phenylobacterium sp.]THD65093.1 MAG: hypothetical protein E8A12_07650 [Phenylobacterium sp.]